MRSYQTEELKPGIGGLPSTIKSSNAPLAQFYSKLHGHDNFILNLESKPDLLRDTDAHIWMLYGFP
jgi:hypothetical protein